MIKAIIISTFILLQLSVFGQKEEQHYNEKAKGYTYVRDRNYKGPDEWFGSSPAPMKQQDLSEIEEEEEYYNGTVPEERLIQTREKSAKKGKGGTLPQDPKTQKADPIEMPDIDAPDIDPPDLPDIDAPTIPENFWKILLIVLLIVAAVLVLYYYLKNKKPSDKKIQVEDKDLEWNPEEITKSELDTRLDEALNSENYRECVRIYFTFILKELIEKNHIRWKKEKTNYEYQLEMTGKPNDHLFRECVRIYDLVWYGEYTLNRQEYEEIKPVMMNYYQMLEKES